MFERKRCGFLPDGCDATPCAESCSRFSADGTVQITPPVQMEERDRAKAHVLLRVHTKYLCYNIGRKRSYRRCHHQ
eukprot:gene15203-biopygen12707